MAASHALAHVRLAVGLGGGHRHRDLVRAGGDRVLRAAKVRRKGEHREAGNPHRLAHHLGRIGHLRQELRRDEGSHLDLAQARRRQGPDPAVLRFRGHRALDALQPVARADFADQDLHDCGSGQPSRASRRGLGKAGAPMAAVRGEEAQQVVHLRVVGGVEDEALLLPPLDEPDAAQVGQVEGERRRREADLLADGAGRHARRARLDEDPEYGEAGLVSERGKEFRGIQGFHGSVLVRRSGDRLDDTAGDPRRALPDPERAGRIAAGIHLEHLRSDGHARPVVGEPAQHAGQGREDDRIVDSRHHVALVDAIPDREVRAERSRDGRVDVSLAAVAAERTGIAGIGCGSRLSG